MADSVIVLFKWEQTRIFLYCFLERDEYCMQTGMLKCALERLLYPLWNKVQTVSFLWKGLSQKQKQLSVAGINNLQSGSLYSAEDALGKQEN